jgi:HD-GYP domain-containing protein (c-di-GMP phosphodiesterase class II)
MEQRRLRVLIVGGDASVWVGLSATFAEDASQIYVPTDAQLATTLGTTTDFDAVVLIEEAGDETLLALREAGLQKKTVILADASDQKLAALALGHGVGAIVVRGAEPNRLASAVRQVAAGGIHYDAPAAGVLRDTVNFANPEKSAGMSAARALVSALELKDTYTGGHAERVTALAVRLAQAADLDEAPVNEALEAAFLLHDVGKIGIPESILTKPAGLTPIERRVLQTHPILGERIVGPLDFPKVVRQVVRHHHERWDGSGYPDGMSGYAIPIAARIFAIADVLDAMTSVRPYRTPVTFAEAMEEITSNAGTHFDPALCRVASEAFFDVEIDVESGVLYDT